MRTPLGAPRELSVAGYARRIEALWSELLQRPLVLSPRDWSLVLGWHSSGIPLEIVREALASAAERESRGKRNRPLRSLGYLAPAVNEAWRVVVTGRVPDDVPAERSEPPDRAWRRRLQAEPTESPLGRLLSDLISRLERGEAATRLDDELDRQLLEAAPYDLVDDVAKELETELAAYRDRISTERLDATRRTASIARLRGRLGLPRLGTADDD